MRSELDQINANIVRIEKELEKESNLFLIEFLKQDLEDERRKLSEIVESEWK